MNDKELQSRYLQWLYYWANAIITQHDADQDAETTEGPLYVDDVDRAINGIIVATLLERIDGLYGQVAPKE